MTLEEQVNQAYDQLEKAKQRLDEINEFDCSRLESPQIRAIEKNKQDARKAVEVAEFEIERLRLVIQARLADRQTGA